MKTALSSKQLEELLNSPCTWDFLIIVKLPKELLFESQLKKSDENGVKIQAFLVTIKKLLAKFRFSENFFVLKIDSGYYGIIK